MRRKFIESSLFISIFLSVGCQTLSKHFNFLKDEEAEKKQALQTQEAIEFNAIVDLSASKDWSKLNEQGNLFLQKHPRSDYFQTVRLMRAKSLYFLGKTEAALGDFKNILLISKSIQPSLAAEASFWIGEIELKSGHETLAKAAFDEADRNSELLNEQMRLAELPVRQAALLARFGEWEEAQKYLQKADQGVRYLLKTHKSKDSQWAAELYASMGESLIIAPDLKNFHMSVKMMRVAQVQLVHAIELNSAEISDRARQVLFDYWTSLWKTTQSYRAPSGIDPALAIRMEKVRKRQMLASFLQLSEDLKIWFPNREQNPSEGMTKLMVFIQKNRESAFKQLYSGVQDTLLTRSGNAPDLTDSELDKLDSVEPGEYNKEDPNL